MDKDTKEIISNVLDLTLKIINRLELVSVGLLNLDKRLTVFEAKINDWCCRNYKGFIKG